ncbi:hypothetical protein VT84_09555 [Gemmata sp. SH-PL17]|uniref:hypothetical protein n=1 Tax=Gemmata sp. SH-PL17 TaxID=1630693 RepID=UPI00078E0F08|nr:hypothetical protein [Gemmata sp. SH-PL17]AMV24630.1 hypothetical protein VT84_09555 [Gemmata sp. SH-PL17]
MLMPISHETWQQLRVLVRAGDKPVPGRDIRYTRSRVSKTGKFLDALVAKGLLAKGTEEPITCVTERRQPVQFRTLYTLTEKGRHAAEYGEYERETIRAIG